MSGCLVCGAELGNPPAAFCPDCGHPSSAASVSASETPAAAPGNSLDFSVRTCPICKVAMTDAGQLQFRVGGHTGGSAMLLGSWNQLSEELQPFEVYHCPRCGRVDLYEAGR